MVRIKSLKNKISLINIAILAVVLLGYTFVVYALMNNLVLRGIDKELRRETHELSDLLDSFLSPASSVITTIQSASAQVIMRHDLSYSQAQNNALTRRILEFVDRYELRDDYVVLLDRVGQTIEISDSVSPELHDQLLRIFFSSKLKNAFTSFSHNGKPLRLLVAPIRLKNGADYVILIATSLRDAERITKVIFTVSFFVVPFVLVLAGLIGRWLTTRILKPVTIIARTADQISHGDLSQRVIVQDTDDEMRHLVQSINQMIERLERSFRHISEFSEHAAHELKTPLTVIRGEAELALRKERPSEEYRRVLEATVRDSQRMIRLVEDMLLISRLEHDAASMAFKVTEFTSFIKDVHEKAKILAHSKGITVSLKMAENDASVLADENALLRVFLNIVDNGVKFTSEHGRIAIGVTLEKGFVRTSISDTGRGIPESELPRIFDKFYHFDQAASIPGNGLGLSIALSIARAHRGDIEVRSQAGQGTTFWVSLPIHK